MFEFFVLEELSPLMSEENLPLRLIGLSISGIRMFDCVN